MSFYSFFYLRILCVLLQIFLIYTCKLVDSKKLEKNRIKRFLKGKHNNQVWLVHKLGESFNTDNRYALNTNQLNLEDRYKTAKIVNITPK
jgi:hypothetical protein